MTFTIFCPSSHLVLSAPQCPVCGWKRPVSGALGEPAWPPFSLKAELGGPGRHVYARLSAAQGVAVLPLQRGVLAGIALADGRELWRTALAQGLCTRAVFIHGSRLLVALSDERPFTEAELGQLAAIEPASGKLTTLWEADAPLLSSPASQGELLFLRTNKPELLALRLGRQAEVRWRAGLNSAGAMLSPAFCGGRVFVSDGEVMSGKSILAAYELETGRPAGALPTDGMLSQPMAACEDVLVYQDGRKRLAALDAVHMKTLWSLSLIHISEPTRPY